MGVGENAGRRSVIFHVVVWGAIWGIFESTAGYLLHLISFGYGWLIWYPAACFFMAGVRRQTGRISPAVFVGLLCATIKMLNLLLPGRIDKVVNPAISIVFEALAMATVVFAAERLTGAGHKKPFVKALMALSMNTGWRLLYILYLLFLVPDWMREVSVVVSAAEFIEFFISRNLITSALIFMGYQFIAYLYRPLELINLRISSCLDAAARFVRPGLAALMLCASIALQLMLR